MLKLASGQTVAYERLISTMPLDLLLRRIEGETDLARQASHFVWSSSHIIGVGMTGQVPEGFAPSAGCTFPR